MAGDDLPLIPNGRFILTFDDPRFCRWGDSWAVVGPDFALPEHGQAEVWKEAIGDWVYVQTGAYLAARTIAHRPGGYRASIRPATRYVVAAIEASGELAWTPDGLQLVVDEPE